MLPPPCEFTLRISKRTCRAALNLNFYMQLEWQLLAPESSLRFTDIQNRLHTSAENLIFHPPGVSFLGRVFLLSFFFLALQVRHMSGLNSSHRFDLFKVVLAQKQPADQKRNLKNL